MSIFNFWKKNKSLKKPEKYKFRVHEIIASGDFYEYCVEAESRDEAFKKLVIWFFGNNRENIKVESRHGEVTMPQHDRFYHSGMPYWFAKRISGWVSEEGKDFQAELEKYCKNNNIQLKS